MDKEKRTKLLSMLEMLNKLPNAEATNVLYYAEGLLRGQKIEQEKHEKQKKGVWK